MEFNHSSRYVKDLSFGTDAKNNIIIGVDKLTKAVKSTLGASGKCVIYEDATGKPVITKDGVTVAESVVLLDPVENIGATLIKEAARNTVKEAGDGTTTATVLASSLLNKVNEKQHENTSIREIKEGIKAGYDKIDKLLSKHSKPVSGEMLKSVAAISCNNDTELGDIIADAYTKVGLEGVVLMEESETDKTYAEIVDGVQLDSGLTSPHFVTDVDKQRCVLEEPAVLMSDSPIPNIRKIQSVLEHVIKTKKSLLIVAEVDEQVKSALLMNKVKGNIKVNIIDPPGFGGSRAELINDLAFLTGSRVINEELGDDFDLIQPDCLGQVVKSVTDNRTTVLTTGSLGEELQVRINDVSKKIKKETKPYFKKKLRERLAMLSGSVGIVNVGADSKVELKEKKDRVEDSIYAVKAALQEGIVAGGGIALLNAANILQGANIHAKNDNIGEKILYEAVKSPFHTILDNAGLKNIKEPTVKGQGIDVITGNKVDMIKQGIIDPVLVTKTALKNAVSVVSTIISADCVINNVRDYESN